MKKTKTIYFYFHIITIFEKMFLELNIKYAYTTKYYILKNISGNPKNKIDN